MSMDLPAPSSGVGFLSVMTNTAEDNDSHIDCHHDIRSTREPSFRCVAKTAAAHARNRSFTHTASALANGLSAVSARRLACRHHWPRQAGDDRIVRVTVSTVALAAPQGVAVSSPPVSGFAGPPPVIVERTGKVIKHAQPDRAA